jgi:hypothetical protein
VLRIERDRERPDQCGRACWVLLKGHQTNEISPVNNKTNQLDRVAKLKQLMRSMFLMKGSAVSDLTTVHRLRPEASNFRKRLELLPRNELRGEDVRHEHIKCSRSPNPTVTSRRRC